MFSFMQIHQKLLNLDFQCFFSVNDNSYVIIKFITPTKCYRHDGFITAFLRSVVLRNCKEDFTLSVPKFFTIFQSENIEKGLGF